MNRYDKFYNPFAKKYTWKEEEKARILSAFADAPVKVSEFKFFKADKRAGSIECQISSSKDNETKFRRWLVATFKDMYLADTRYGRGFYQNYPAMFRLYPFGRPVVSLDDSRIRAIFLGEAQVQCSEKPMANLRRMIGYVEAHCEVKIAASLSSIRIILDAIEARIKQAKAEDERAAKEQTIWLKKTGDNSYEVSTTWTNWGDSSRKAARGEVAIEPVTLSATDTWIAVRMFMLKNGWRVSIGCERIFNALAIKLADAYLTADVSPVVSVDLSSEEE